MGDFLDWYGRAMLARMNVEMLPETVVHRRIHANNYQRTHKHQRREYLRAVKDLLDRRRGFVSQESIVAVVLLALNGLGPRTSDPQHHRQPTRSRPSASGR